MTPGRWGPRTLARAALLLALFAVPQRSQAQQRRDTTRTDTLRADTLRQDTVPRDTTPPPHLVTWPDSLPAPSFAAGVWEWDRDQLLLDGEITLLDLLHRIPGVTILRSGVFLEPEAATALTTGGTRLRVEWDGFVLDPLNSAALDLSTIELVHLHRVRVERRVDVLLVKLTSEASLTAQPYSRIAAGVGQPRTNLFRGMLLAPRFLIGPIGLAVERVELTGGGRAEPADNFSTWLRWGVLHPDRGIEVQFRRNRLNRDPDAPFPEQLTRQDVVLRARTRLGSALVGELYGGRSSEKIIGADPLLPDSLQRHIDRSATQAGGRLAMERGSGAVLADFRWRNLDALPHLEASLSAHGQVGARLQGSGEIAHQSWSNVPGAISMHAFGAADLLTGLRLFAEFGSGARGAAGYAGDTTLGPRRTRSTVLRGGAELTWHGLHAAGALLHVRADSIALFGLATDTGSVVVPGDTVTGWETSVHLPLIRKWLWAEGSYATWFSGRTGAYRPVSLGTGGLDIHTIPLPSGNLELMARIEATRRGAMLTPPLDVGSIVPAHTVLSAYFQIRVIDVRIFVRFDDMTGADIGDLPGIRLAGPRIVYGVKWSFLN